MKLPKCPECSSQLPKMSLVFKSEFACSTCKSGLSTNVTLVSFVESLIGLPVLIAIAWVVEVSGYNESTYKKALAILMVPVSVLHYFVLCTFLRIDKTDGVESSID